MPNGILIVNKPAGWTSQDVAAKLRGVFHEKRVGHGGTLDPMATGVLPIFIGRATRAVPFFEHADKEYEAVLRLGLVTDTQDITGRTLEEHPVDVTPEQLEAALGQFRGEIQQIPPMYSAIKVNGQKLYALARQGKEIERQPRPVTIYELKAIGNRQQAIGDGGHEATGKAFPLRGRCPEGADEVVPDSAPAGDRETDYELKAIGNRQQAIGDGGREATGKAFPLRGRCPEGADEVVPDSAPAGDGRTDYELKAIGNRQQAIGDGGREATGKAFPLRGRCPEGADEVVPDSAPAGDGGTDCHGPEGPRNDRMETDTCPLSPVTCHLQIHCSKGTYVRTLCHDVGQALGCGGCMAALTRTRAGAYTLAQSHTMEEILAAPDPEQLLLPIDSLFSDRPAVTVNETGEKKLRNGARLKTPRLTDGEYRVYSRAGEFLLLGVVRNGELHTVKSFFEV